MALWPPAGVMITRDSVVTPLYGVTPEALGAWPGSVFTGGRVMWYFRGAVVARGDWEDMMSPEVPIENTVMGSLGMLGLLFPAVTVSAWAEDSNRLR